MSKKRVTVRDIARRLGISHMTVSRALSADPKVSALVAEKTRERVQKLATELDYTPNLLARAFLTGRSGTLGLLTFKIYRETLGSQADQILRAAKRQDYQILVSLAANRFSEASLDDQIQQIKELIARGVEGLLIHTRGEEDESERILNTVKGRVPVVIFGHPTTQDLSGVVLDDTASFAEITAHLIRLGHERIGFIGSDWNRNRVGSAKGRGYFQAMQEHGLTPERLPANSLIRSGHQLGKETRDRFTAYVCRSDYLAIGLCRGLREAGLRIPEDVAVVGYGDLDVSAYFTPALTTLQTPYEQVAEAMMELMLEQLQGNAAPRKVTLTHRLIVRESCGTGACLESPSEHCPSE